MKLGAFDYLTKPFQDEELLALVRRAVEKRSLEREVTFLRGELARRHDRDEIVGEHPEMQKLARLVTQVARTTTTVLISGESGTGKELIARAIHHRGPRRDKPFVPVNPAAIPEALVESELFGHEQGAFTGAHQRSLAPLGSPRLVSADLGGRESREANKRSPGRPRVAPARRPAGPGPGAGRGPGNADAPAWVRGDGPPAGPADLPLDVTLAP